MKTPKAHSERDSKKSQSRGIFFSGMNTPGDEMFFQRDTYSLATEKKENNPFIQRSGESSGSSTYSEEERRNMREGTVEPSSRDLEIASSNNFEPGDIVFRLGSRNLAELIDNPVTHGGIYLGNGLIHDMVGFGNRTVRVSLFYQEADDSSVVKVLRFIGPLNDMIIPRLIDNIEHRNFRLPSDQVPFNLFSTADNYETATCLEYSHAQFLYAIKELVESPVIRFEVQERLRETYYEDGAENPKNLINPQEVEQYGSPGTVVPQIRAMVAAADYLADDVDEDLFENRLEGLETSYENYGNSWFPSLVETVSFNTFTYRSFKNSRSYFREVH